MRRSFAVVALLMLLLVACGDGDSDSATDGGTSGENTTMPGTEHDDEHGEHGAEGESADADCSPSGTNVSIVAEDTKFDKSCLAAPANQAFTLSYDNRDAIAHNIVFLESHTATDVMFRADIFTGPKASKFNVDALGPGTYAFHCEVHPSVMTGTLVVK